MSILRLVNFSTSTAQIQITGRDDAGFSGGTVRLSLAPGASRAINAQALESGSGVDGSLGNGTGKWRLTVSSNVDIHVMSLLQSPTGHLANLSTSPSIAGIDDGGTDDHPDTLAAAVTVAHGQTVHGSIDSPNDIDFFKVRLTEPSTVSFWTTGVADTVITLRDGNGNALPTVSASNAGDADIAYNSGGRVTVLTPLEQVYADIRGRPGGRTGSYALHNEVVAQVRDNLRPIIVRRILPITLKAGASTSVDFAGAFRDPEGAALTYTANITSRIGPISLGLTVSGTALRITAPGNMPTGPVTIAITASDPLGLLVTQILTVTIQPGSNPEPPGDGPDGCVTVRVYPFNEGACQVTDGGGYEYGIRFTNSCSYTVRLRFHWNPWSKESSGWSGGATSVRGNGTNTGHSTQCLDNEPRARICAYTDDSSRCYGSNPQWRNVN